MYILAKGHTGALTNECGFNYFTPFNSLMISTSKKVNNHPGSTSTTTTSGKETTGEELDGKILKLPAIVCA